MALEIHSERGGDSTITRISDEKMVFIIIGACLLWIASLLIVAFVATNGFCK